MLSTRPSDSSRNPLLIQAAHNLIARHLKMEARDPVLLAKRAGLDPDKWQAGLLRNRARQIILLCSRQTGKSTISSLLALHEAIYSSAALVLLLSPSLRQSQELFRKIKTSYDALESHHVTAHEVSTLRMEFSNESRIIALPGKEATLRGFSGVSTLIVDEAARVPDDLYMAIRPMLAVSGGRIILASTPFGKRGFFHHEWTEGGDSWSRVKITAHDCPRISEEWLAAERAKIGNWWFGQEYLCEFSETTDQVFAYQDIMRALETDAAPLFGEPNVA